MTQVEQEYEVRTLEMESFGVYAKDNAEAREIAGGLLEQAGYNGSWSVRAVEPDYTPGPWTASGRWHIDEYKPMIPPRPSRYLIGIQGLDGLAHIADVFAENDRIGKANANLIASAPELLEEVKRDVVTWENISRNIRNLSDVEKVRLARCKALIAKAEGKEVSNGELQEGAVGQGVG